MQELRRAAYDVRLILRILPLSCCKKQLVLLVGRGPAISGAGLALRLERACGLSNAAGPAPNPSHNCRPAPSQLMT